MTTMYDGEERVLPMRQFGSTPVSLASNQALAAGASTEAQTFALGGDYRWTVIASTFGGGTASLESLGPDNETWLPFNPVAELTANGSENVGIPDGGIVRMTLTGGTGATGVYATLARLP